MQEDTGNFAATTGPSEIRFYSTLGGYPWLSNFFYRGLIDDDGLDWPTVEHYFQAQKFPHDAGYREEIRNAPTPGLAKRAGRARPCCANWDDIRDEVMLYALRRKFSQWGQGREWLIGTGDAILIEDSPTDAYWGGSLPGSKNRLGALLMQVRDEFRNATNVVESEKMDEWDL